MSYSSFSNIFRYLDISFTFILVQWKIITNSTEDLECKESLLNLTECQYILLVLHLNIALWLVLFGRIFAKKSFILPLKWVILKKEAILYFIIVYLFPLKIHSISFLIMTDKDVYSKVLPLLMWAMWPTGLLFDWMPLVVLRSLTTFQLNAFIVCLSGLSIAIDPHSLGVISVYLCSSPVW